MGGSASTTAVNELSTAISNVAISTVQSCEVSVSQDQSLNINNSGLSLWGNYKLQQQTDISSTCFSDVQKQTQLQNAIMNTIAQTSTADGVALLSAFGASTADATANLTSLIQNNVTMSNIQQSYNNIKQNQSATVTNSGVMVYTQVELTQGAKIFAAATLQEVDKAGIFNQISSYVDQKSTATTSNPLDFLSKIFGAISSSIVMGIILVLVIIAAIAFGAYYFMGGTVDMGSLTAE
jgi:hypothetical protein